MEEENKSISSQQRVRTGSENSINNVTEETSFVSRMPANVTGEQPDAVGGEANVNIPVIFEGVQMNSNNVPQVESDGHSLRFADKGTSSVSTFNTKSSG